ncbi:malto-oligosyltrehalose trehalohydrolase [Mucilaginibacter sp. UR6-1]|uniref:malto-oligosyltrehalose trehalohydrolase n=1 Tax=Mucilaginibacter sp. UR6-1 TaxID=1435643 RepID=UPI001E2FBB1B|nr:malto-oligosyltrehalose trehalohydrolase [Mucilaginibacter sp. UR6-1]MCC8407552.1 malto-oligosyltrehalose trehalohydrolase [Mucilaginibacter sp. UR6-1]
MKNPQINKRSLGVSFDKLGVAHVTLWAPLAKEVAVLIGNEKSELALQAGEYGYWTLSTDKLKPGDTYTFSLNGEKERPDPASLAQPDSVHGPSKAVDITAFSWTDAKWANPKLDDYIFYELHIGTFTAEGTFEAAIDKLDHLVELGVTAVEIMPVAQFPGDRNWGYDGVLPYAVQNTYGGAEGLMRLVDACHAKGLAVVLDVVYNHLGPEGNYFNDFGAYFTDKYHTPWGNAINFDDAWCDAVRLYYIENALMWFRDFHIDALRMDAVHAIKDLSPVHILKEIKQHVNRLIAETGRQHHLIAELDLNDPVYINTLEEHGYGIDGQWIDEFHHALRVTAGEPQTGYYSDFNGIEHLAKAYRDAYVYDGIYSPHRQKVFGVKAEKNTGNQFVVFSQNHDQVGNRMLGERTSTLVSFEMQKLMAAAVMVSPYMPMLFMGEEWGETNPFQYFISHTDKELVEAVRKGRREEFKAFHAEGETPDPQAEETFNRSKLQWDLLFQSKHQTMFAFYKELIKVRKQHPALKYLNRSDLNVDYNKEKNTLLLQRRHGDEKVCCAMNFSDQQQNIALPAGPQWVQLLNSANQQWGGNASEVTPGVVEPESIIIYINHYV